MYSSDHLLLYGGDKAGEVEVAEVVGSGESGDIDGFYAGVKVSLAPPILQGLFAKPQPRYPPLHGHRGDILQTPRA